MTAPVFYPRGPLPVEFMAEIHRRIRLAIDHGVPKVDTSSGELAEAYLAVRDLEAKGVRP